MARGSTGSIPLLRLWRMAMGTRDPEQPPLWIAASDLPVSPEHPFYTRLNALLEADGFDTVVEDACRSFYAPVLGRPSLAVLATSFIRDGCGLPTPPFGSRGGARPTPGRPRCACRALRGQAAAAGSGSAACASRIPNFLAESRIEATLRGA